MKKILLLSLLLGACGKFEDPTIVIDLRVLGMVAYPPEQLVPYDPNNPPDPSTIHLEHVYIGALVADPGASRALEYTMTACPPASGDRCDPSEPSVVIGGGTIEDPDETGQQPDAIMEPSPQLFAVIEQAAKDDPLKGFSGIDIMIEMRVNPHGATEEQAVYGTKGVRFGAQVPADRTPNQNPSATFEIRSEPDDGNAPRTLSNAPCAARADVQPMDLAAGESLRFQPMEPPGARETYVVPTFDGGSLTLTENLSYAWFTGEGGSWDSGSTGGPRDAFGNDPPLSNVFTADRVTTERFVPIYIVQRDERLGQMFYVDCLRIHP
ncbi:MAG TPA: hypothetical protein VL463_33935 [Kofleriaceae bacterium]|nr:hypothetical protein [Kofleriaceae bacterium]